MDFHFLGDSSRPMGWDNSLNYVGSLYTKHNITLQLNTIQRDLSRVEFANAFSSSSIAYDYDLDHKRIIIVLLKPERADEIKTLNDSKE